MLNALYEGKWKQRRIREHVDLIDRKQKWPQHLIVVPWHVIWSNFLFRWNYTCFCHEQLRIQSNIKSFLKLSDLSVLRVLRVFDEFLTRFFQVQLQSLCNREHFKTPQTIFQNKDFKSFLCFYITQVHYFPGNITK